MPWNMPHLIQWRWNWSMPNLESLNIHADLHSLSFSFGFLSMCPCLKSVIVDSLGPKPYPLQTALQLEKMPDHERKSHQTNPCRNASVTTLKLTGGWLVPPLPSRPRTVLAQVQHSPENNTNASNHDDEDDLDYHRHPLVYLLTDVFPSLSELEYLLYDCDRLQLAVDIVQVTLPNQQYPFPTRLEHVWLLGLFHDHLKCALEAKLRDTFEIVKLSQPKYRRFFSPGSSRSRISAGSIVYSFVGEDSFVHVNKFVPVLGH